MFLKTERDFQIFSLLMLVWGSVESFRCDRRPHGSTTRASAPDGRFKLSVEGADEDAYIPDQVYTVKLSETDGESRFTLFIISAEGDQKPDVRKPQRLYPGELKPVSPITAKYSDRCMYSVEQASSSFKDSVEVYWQAPPAGSGCVTFRAMVAENEEVWFEDGAPLTVKICEDMRQPDDVTPQLNYECGVCDEAKYELMFTGVWSRNTHPQNYPENEWEPRYSDLAGASHNTDFVLWSPGTLASAGLRDLAEYANTTQLEAEIREKIGDGVRTLIKGKGHGYRKMRSPTYAVFRADKDNHLLTVAVALHPSPDWFLGVTRFELCQADNTWLLERELNLFPWDAGTDSGISYESPNLQTFPQDAVGRVQMSSLDSNSPFYQTEMKDLHPFGKLEIKLVKTYHRECEEETGDSEGPNPDEGGSTNEEQSGVAEPEEPSRYQNQDDNGRVSPIETDPESPEDCPISQWQEWSPCEGNCVNGQVTGYKWRQRYHLVDGIAVEKYDPDAKGSKKEVPENCKTHYDDFETNECTSDCSENTEITASRRRYGPIIPGHPWNSKKRDLPKIRA